MGGEKSKERSQRVFDGWRSHHMSGFLSGMAKKQTEQTAHTDQGKKLRHCHVYKADTPRYVVVYLKGLHNKYGGSNHYTPLEYLRDIKANKISWEAYKKEWYQAGVVWAWPVFVQEPVGSVQQGEVQRQV